MILKLQKKAKFNNLNFGHLEDPFDCWIKHGDLGNSSSETFRFVSIVC